MKNAAKKLKVVGLGAGGHAKVVIEILKKRDDCEIVGFLDSSPKLAGQRVLGIPVIGDDSLIQGLQDKGISHVFIGVGTVGSTQNRRLLYQRARKAGLEVIQAVHPQAVISQTARLGYGITVMAGAVINALAHIEENVIVNTGSIIEHDCFIGAHSHIATGARLAGGVHIEEGAHVGLGASILQGIRIGKNAVVGAGAVVIRDVPEGTVVVGVPAAPVGKTAFK